MDNRIDKIITLSNNEKYMVLDQANYNGKSYYLVSKLDGEDNLSEEFEIFENDNEVLKSVNDEKLFNSLIEYFKKRVDTV